MLLPQCHETVLKLSKKHNTNKMPTQHRHLSQDNPGITQPIGESQEITLVVVNILAYSVYIQYICDLHPDI